LDKSLSLLYFLRDVAVLKRRRSPSYGQAETVLWLSDVPADRSASAYGKDRS